jgi:hypothetical protein
MSGLSSYWLRRWSLLVRLRDGFTCYVCGRVCKKTAQAHHVYAKAVHPEKAYDLDNGVTVCADCHQPRIHAQWTSWRKWTGFFRRYLKYVRVRKFNTENQSKIRRHR